MPNYINRIFAAGYKNNLLPFILYTCGYSNIFPGALVPLIIFSNIFPAPVCISQNV